MGLHHGIGEEHLPFDGADRENREATDLWKLAQPIGEVAFPVPAQPRDPVRGNVVEEALREIEALQVLQAVQQPVGVGGIGSRLELPEPHEPRHVGVVDRLAEQILKSPAKSGRNAFGDAGFDPAFGVDQRVGAKPLNRRRGRQDRSRLPAGFDEPARQVLVRPRQRRLFAEPVAVLTRRVIEATGVLEVDMGWVNGNYQRSLGIDIELQASPARSTAAPRRAVSCRYTVVSFSPIGIKCEYDCRHR